MNQYVTHCRITKIIDNKCVEEPIVNSDHEWVYSVIFTLPNGEEIRAKVADGILTLASDDAWLTVEPYSFNSIGVKVANRRQPQNERI